MTQHTFRYFLAKLENKQDTLCADNTTREERMASLREHAIGRMSGHYAILERIDGDLFRIVDEVRIEPDVEIRDVRKLPSSQK